MSELHRISTYFLVLILWEMTPTWMSVSQRQLGYSNNLNARCRGDKLSWIFLCVTQSFIVSFDAYFLLVCNSHSDKSIFVVRSRNEWDTTVRRPDGTVVTRRPGRVTNCLLLLFIVLEFFIFVTAFKNFHLTYPTDIPPQNFPTPFYSPCHPTLLQVEKILALLEY